MLNCGHCLPPPPFLPPSPHFLPSFLSSLHSLYILTASSNTLVIWCEELTHWKRPWCWEDWRQEKGDDRGWDGWMTSPTQWTWVWASSRSWWWTERPGVVLSIGSQRVRHDWVTELNWWSCKAALNPGHSDSQEQCVLRTASCSSLLNSSGVYTLMMLWYWPSGGMWSGLSLSKGNRLESHSMASTCSSLGCKLQLLQCFLLGLKHPMTSLSISYSPCLYRDHFFRSWALISSLQRAVPPETAISLYPRAHRDNKILKGN